MKISSKDANAFYIKVYEFLVLEYMVVDKGFQFISQTGPIHAY